MIPDDDGWIDPPPTNCLWEEETQEQEEEICACPLLFFLSLHPSECYLLIYLLNFLCTPVPHSHRHHPLSDSIND